eukprot:gene3261-22127_t
MVVASYTLLLAAAGSSGAAALASSTGKVNLTLTSNHMSTTTWNQLGKTLRRENTQAISLDYGPDGFPVFAYGWDDPDMSNGTRIPVMAFNGKDFLEVYHRTSQFPQNYREFVFKAARNAYYLGLR